MIAARGVHRGKVASDKVQFAALQDIYPELPRIVAVDGQIDIGQGQHPGGLNDEVPI